MPNTSVPSSSRQQTIAASVSTFSFPSGPVWSVRKHWLRNWQKVDDALRRYDESLQLHCGAGGLWQYVLLPCRTTVVISLVSTSVWWVRGDRDVTLETVCDEMREDLKGYPELDKAQVILAAAQAAWAPRRADFEVYGYDFTATDKVSAELKEKLLQVKVWSEVNISRQDYQPEYQVDFDREKLALHGLNLLLPPTICVIVNGALASYYREDGDEYDIRVRYAPDSVQRLKIWRTSLFIRLPVRVSAWKTRQSSRAFCPPTIERKDRERIVTVSGGYFGSTFGDVVADGNAIIDKMDLPSGVSIQISGSLWGPTGFILRLGERWLYWLLFCIHCNGSQFESLSYPFIIMFSIPFAFSGVLMALFFTGNQFECDVVWVESCWLVLWWRTVSCWSTTSRLPRTWSSGASLCSHGRPQPFASGINDYTDHYPRYGADGCRAGEGAEMWRPLGVAVIGGLTVSTILTLILVPCSIARFAGVGIRRTREDQERPWAEWLLPVV